MSQTHLAFDLGLRTTGIAWPGGSDHLDSPARLHRSPITPERAHDRYCWWRTAFVTILADHPNATVVVEAPIIHHAHRRGSIPLIVLHGILRACAHDRAVVEVEPSRLKRWATGKGNADKVAMVAAARLRGWDGDDHNEADAFLLYTYHAQGGTP